MGEGKDWKAWKQWYKDNGLYRSKKSEKETKKEIETQKRKI